MWIRSSQVVERLTANAVVDTVKSEGRQVKEC